VSGQNTGSGGNLSVTANALTLDHQGQLIAETTSSDGGNINLNVRDILLLRRNSLISASAGTAQAGGDGGNVTIKAGFVVGVLLPIGDFSMNTLGKCGTKCFKRSCRFP
jgi:large exoprotein involved in heme utilization and adhesion